MGQDTSLSHTLSHWLLRATAPPSGLCQPLVPKSPSALWNIKERDLNPDLLNLPLSTEFLVQFEENHWEPGRWRNLSSYPGHLNSVILQLAPFVNYQFRVIAINSVGQSEPSLSSPRYRTSGAGEKPPERPRAGSRDGLGLTMFVLAQLQMSFPEVCEGGAP